MQEGTRVLAVALSNDVFDKLDDYVKEMQVTKNSMLQTLLKRIWNRNFNRNRNLQNRLR